MTTLLTYFLIKITPAWGLALLFTTLTYFVPLAYISNKELIDHHLNNASEIVSKQTQQVRELAGQHTSKASEMAQGAFKDYSARASDLVGTAKKTAVEKGVVSEATAAKVPGGQANPNSASVPGSSPLVKEENFPSAPKTDPLSSHDGASDSNPLSNSGNSFTDNNNSFTNNSSLGGLGEDNSFSGNGGLTGGNGNPFQTSQRGTDEKPSFLPESGLTGERRAEEPLL